MIRKLRIAIARFFIAIAKFFMPRALTMDEAIEDFVANLKEKMHPGVAEAATKVTNSPNVEKVGVIQIPMNNDLPSPNQVLSRTDHPEDYELKEYNQFEEDISKAIIDALKAEEPKKAVQEDEE